MARGDDASLAAGRRAFREELRAAKNSWLDVKEDQQREERLFADPGRTDLEGKYAAVRRDGRVGIPSADDAAPAFEARRAGEE